MGKKKKGGGEPKGPKAKPVTDGLLPIDMSRKQLLGHLVRLKDELDREREERNYYMLERERMYQRWNLYMEQISIEKAKVQSLKSHLEDTSKDKQDEDNLYEQKLRFLKQEQSRKLGQLRLIHLQKMAQVQDDAWQIHMVMKEELMNKKKEIRRAQIAFYQMIRGLHWAHAKAVSDLRNDFAREIRRLESNFDRSLFERNEKLEEDHDKELSKMAVAKEEQIKYLIEDHAWQADQMKAFFQELLKISLDIVQQMKVEVKQQTTAELMQRRDYEHFKHRYDVYVAPALRWSSLMDEWQIAHQEDNLNELINTLKLKEEELKKRKYNLRMLEAANEALNQRILIAEKERNCIKKQFCRSIVDSQRTASMKRFCHQLKRRAARDEAEVYLALNKLVRDRGSGVNHFKKITDQKDEELLDLMLDINQHAKEHLETQFAFADAFEDNEINLDDIGYPIQQVGANPISNQDMENLVEANKNWKPPDDEDIIDDELWLQQPDSGYDLTDAPTVVPIKLPMESGSAPAVIMKASQQFLEVNEQPENLHRDSSLLRLPDEGSTLSMMMTTEEEQYDEMTLAQEEDMGTMEGDDEYTTYSAADAEELEDTSEWIAHPSLEEQSQTEETKEIEEDITEEQSSNEIQEEPNAE